MTPGPDAATAHAWTALGGDEALLERVSFHGPPGLPDARLPVRELARATVAACSLAAAELTAARGGRAVPAVRTDEDAVATAFVSERHLRIDGRAATTFAPLSGFWRTADSWVRTHANYPHHRARLLAALGLPDGEDEAAVHRLAAVLRELPAEQVQERAYAAGALAVAVAAPGPAAGHPLVEAVRVGEAAARPLAGAPLPCTGIRVLDLTRVIAGPVATRTLALFGADVLRIDPPHLPESADAHADTGFGKRSTRLDLAAPADRAVFEDLLAGADVVVTGYRPGALDRLGLAPEALLERRPGLVVGQLDAWGRSGRWSGRRGFDSLVQAGTGIATIEAGPDGRPGALPAQALDHGTGYLLAAAVLRALTDRGATGGGRLLRLSLAGTADWLLHGIRPVVAEAAAGPSGPVPRLAERDSPIGRLRYAPPPAGYEGGPTDWSRPPGRWGTDAPVWS
ncbi:putative L-carnitine dehydratase [Kitasatospora indigofera]|uniref:L-carnitine dehydratase n=1 Tax=Kitasatospora indigofera TaxID=67307 RepID=A0A919KUR2_9ACTN|nr:CoA transferase [Kitasatospora indigofera]GHH73348.1 putative L-carnitine dehydratase [Kitasatospora indigofera]